MKQKEKRNFARKIILNRPQKLNFCVQRDLRLSEAPVPVGTKRH